MVGILALVVIGVVVVIAMNGKDSTKDGMKMSNPSTSSKSVAPAAAPADAVEATAVSIQDYNFGPKDIKVKVGTTVTWTNQDSVHHTVTADNASADAPKSELFGKGETYSFTFKKAGTYSYHCEPHPYMKGTVTVTE